MVRASISDELIDYYAQRLGVTVEKKQDLYRVAGHSKWKKKQAMYQYLYRRLRSVTEGI